MGWPDWFAKAGCTLPVKARFARFEHMFFALEAALDGLGVALMPSALVVDDLAAGRLAIAWKVPGVYERDYYHLLSPLTRQAGIAKSFVAWLSKEGGESNKLGETVIKRGAPKRLGSCEFYARPPITNRLGHPRPPRIIASRPQRDMRSRQRCSPISAYSISPGCSEARSPASCWRSSVPRSSRSSRWKAILSRRVSSHSTEFDGDSGFFLSVNRGKSSIALDLKKPEGRAVMYDLARNADAVIYGFAPAVPARLGLDRASLHGINPRLTIAQLIGLHDEPPYADAPAFDLVVQAMAGVMSITGERDGAPVRVGYQVADLVGGLYLALGCVGGMLKSLKSGKGELVQVSLLDCQLAMLTWQAQNYFISGEQPFANGARHPVIAPSDIYRLRGRQVHRGLADRPAASGRSSAWRSADRRSPRTRASLIPRAASRTSPPLTELLSEVFRSRTSAEWGAQLFAERVPAAPVNGVAEAVAQPLRDAAQDGGGASTSRRRRHAEVSRQSVQVRGRQAAVLSAGARRGDARRSRAGLRLRRGRHRPADRTQRRLSRRKK